jgi:carbonic anhydrase/acetyltransferase-like protein (isoleucine patch superfamily)
MKKLVIIGAGGNARELADMLRVFPEFQVLGFLTNTRGKYDSPVLGDFSWPAAHDVDAFAMGIGDPIAKFRVGQELAMRYPQVEWPLVVHPTAYVGNGVKLGKGAIVCVRAVATVGVQLGDFSQLNFGCTVGHESVIGAGSLVNPGANGLRQPLCQIEGEANPATGIEQQRLPGGDGRKPQFIGGVPQLSSDARIQTGWCLQCP